MSSWMKISQLSLKLQALTLQTRWLKKNYLVALIFKHIIGVVLSFQKCVSLLESNLTCKSYKCFNGGLSCVS